MLKAEIQFGQFLPDHPDFQNPGCVRANNVFPSAGGYDPFRGAGNTSGSTSGACRGAAFYARTTGDAITVGGGDDKLWVDVSGVLTATTGLSSIGSDAYWQFHQFNSFVFAVSINNDLMHLSDIDTDTSWSAVTDAPARAEVIGQVGNHLMVGNLSSNPFGFQWSGLNDPTTFTADAINMAGTGSAQQEYGKITGIAGDRFSMLFQEYGISRIAFVGPPTVFQLETIEEARGAIAPNSIVTVGHTTFFLAHDGFWSTNGAASQPIGTSRVNEFFRENASSVDLFRTCGAVDWDKQSVVWAYASASGGGALDKLIIFSWAENRWATADLPVEWLVQGTVNATTMDDTSSEFDEIDSIDGSPDSARFQARGRRLSAYLTSGANTQLTALDGDTLEADFETGEFQPSPGQRAMMTQIGPIVENAGENTRAQAITRSKKGGAETFSGFGAINDAGWCPVRAEGLYSRAAVNIPAGGEWKNAQGVQVGYRGAGMR